MAECFGFRRRPSSLYTFLRARLGSGLAAMATAFPDFERFYSGDFPPGTPQEVCCVYQFRHVRAWLRSLQDGLEARVGIEPAYTALQAAA